MTSTDHQTTSLSETNYPETNDDIDMARTNFGEALGRQLAFPLKPGLQHPKKLNPQLTNSLSVWLITRSAILSQQYRQTSRISSTEER